MSSVVYSTDVMKHIKIIFMGTPKIAKGMLQRLIDDGYNIVGVVSQPDKKVGRKQELSMSCVKQLALEHSIPVFQPYKIKEDYQDILDLHADLIVTCAYGQFIPEIVLQAPTYGSINVHASLLPKLRGGAPIHKAIINGEHQSGVSIMRMVAKMDAGDVMSQCSVTIEDDDTAGSLFDKIEVAGASLLSESIVVLIAGDAIFVKQDEAQASFAYTISKDEEYVDFHRDVQVVYNHIRGLIPSPVGHTIMDGKKVKLHKVRYIHDCGDHVAGRLVGLVDQGFAIETINGLILIDEIQIEGKAKCDAKSFYNGVGKQLVLKKCKAG